MIIELGVIAGIIIIVLAIFWLGWLAKGMHDDRKQYLAELREAEERPEPRHAVRPRKGSAGLPHIETLNYLNKREVREVIRSSPRLVTTAADIAPVFLPEPGTRIPLTPQASPAPSGTATTGTLPRIKLDTATTGEIRAVGAELVRQIESGELVP